MTRAVSMSASLESKSESPSSKVSSARAVAARARSSKYFMVRSELLVNTWERSGNS